MITYEALLEYCGKNKIPAFRAKQVLEALYQKGVESFDDITALPMAVRAKFAAEFADARQTVTPVAYEVSGDHSTEKILFALRDGSQVEAVLMNFADGRKTVCVSSEVGCPLKCGFCASGTLKFKRSLTGEEIADQVLYFARKLRARKEEINHVVYMGIGEPFRNYDEVMKSLRILMDKQYLGLGARKITVSTAGIVEKIKQFADEPFQVNLALSLHAPTQELRQKIMPIARRYPLDELMDAVRYYVKKTHRRISFEYVMLNGINDTEECAMQLAKLIKGMLCHVNMIPYNATDIVGITGSTRETMRRFKKILTDNGVNATIRVSLGQDIAAACGQLANKAENAAK